MCFIGVFSSCIIGVIIISLFLAIGSEEFLIFHYNIQNGSIREAVLNVCISFISKSSTVDSYPEIIVVLYNAASSIQGYSK